MSWPTAPSARASASSPKAARRRAKAPRSSLLLGERIGTVTSGGFGPSVNGPVAMGYVEAAHARPGTPVNLMVRGKALPAQVAPLPFTPHRYARKQVSDPPGLTP